VVPRTDTNVWSSAYLVEVQTGAVLFLRFDDFDAEGRAQVRLPRGTYDINAVAGSDDPAHLSRPWLATLVSEPEVALSSDTSVTLDTRRGRPVSVSIDRPSAVRVEESLSITSIAPNGSGGTIGVGGGEQLQIFAVPSRAATGHSYIFEYNSILASSPLASAGSGDPFVYNLLFYDDGIPEQLAFRAPDSELAAVRTDYHVQAAPASGLRFDMAFTPGVPIAIALGFEVPLPGRRIEYFSAGRGIAWSHTLAVGDFPFGETTESFQEYRPGRSRTAWNRAPLGPAVAPYTGARRFGDYIRTDVSLFAGNQDGHVVWFAERPGISGTTSLSRDGVVIGSNDLPCVGAFAVPPARVPIRWAARWTAACRGLRWPRGSRPPGLSGTPERRPSRAPCPCSPCGSAGPSISRTPPEQASRSRCSSTCSGSRAHPRRWWRAWRSKPRSTTEPPGSPCPSCGSPQAIAPPRSCTIRPGTASCPSARGPRMPKAIPWIRPWSGPIGSCSPRDGHEPADQAASQAR
jgi:hypothetical protein